MLSMVYDSPQDIFMTFSVIISVNGQTELTRSAIRSVLNQRKCASGAEIIVVDDAWSHSVQKLVEEFPAAYITYVQTPERDPSQSMAAGYAASSGDYVLWMGYDDFLLPYAFSAFENALTHTYAEVVTGLHVYYYDRAYPRAWFRNRLHLVHTRHYDGSYQELDLDALRRTALRLPWKKGDPFWFHLHPPVTLMSRTLLERVRAHARDIVVPRMQCNHSQQVMACALARSAVGIGLPLAIIGRFGISFTQEFHAPERKKRRTRYPIRWSPVTGDTFVNHIFETLLAGRERVMRELEHIPFSYAPLLNYYVKDLVWAREHWQELRRLWQEAELVARRLASHEQARLIPLVHTMRRLSFLLHPFKFLPLWERLRMRIVPSRSLASTVWHSLRRLWNPYAAHRRKNIFIPLARYRADDIAALAAQLPHIVHAETGKILPQ